MGVPLRLEVGLPRIKFFEFAFILGVGLRRSFVSFIGGSKRFSSGRMFRLGFALCLFGFATQLPCLGFALLLGGQICFGLLQRRQPDGTFRRCFTSPLDGIVQFRFESKERLGQQVTLQVDTLGF